MACVQNVPGPLHALSRASAHDMKEPPVQHTNYGSPIPRSKTGWLVATPRDTPTEELRRRYRRDGYLWLKNVIPRSDVLDMREAYFEHMNSHRSFLEPGSSARQGIFDRRLDPLEHQGVGATANELDHSMLDTIHDMPVYRHLLSHEKLRQAVRQVNGWNGEILMKRGLIRHNVPGSKAPSGIHYDQLFLRAGDPVFVSAWIPIGDCPGDGGGLMYLEDSKEKGKEIEQRFKKRQGKEKMSEEERVSAFNRHMDEFGHLSHNSEEWVKQEGLQNRWLVGNFEAGDVVFHHPWTIHSSSKNNDEMGRIRLSTDLRFYEKGANYDQRWTKPFFHGDGL